MAKTKLIAVCAITLGSKARLVEPGATFEVDASEADWLVAQGAARAPVAEDKADDAGEKGAAKKAAAEKLAAEKVAAEKAEADRVEAERLAAEQAAGGGQGSLT